MMTRSATPLAAREGRGEAAEGREENGREEEEREERKEGKHRIKITSKGKGQMRGEEEIGKGRSEKSDKERKTWSEMAEGLLETLGEGIHGEG